MSATDLDLPAPAESVTPPPSLKAVVCDDDPMIRTVIGRVAAMAGVEVVAESDTPEEAIELVQRAGADELILDLALSSGRGETALELVKSRALRCRVVVFSSFVSEPEQLLAAGAAAVVTKPDFALLEEVLADHARNPSADGERRQAAAHRPLPPAPAFLSPSGIAPPSELPGMLDALVAGDAVVALSLEGLPQAMKSHGPVVATDLLLHAGRVARDVLRAQDRVLVDDDGVLVLLVLKASTQVVRAVWARLQEAWIAAGAPAPLRAGYVVVADHDLPRAAHPAARAALDEALGRGRELQLGLT